MNPSKEDETWREYVIRNNIGYAGTWKALSVMLALLFFSGVFAGVGVMSLWWPR